MRGLLVVAAVRGATAIRLLRSGGLSVIAALRRLLVVRTLTAGHVFGVAALGGHAVVVARTAEQLHVFGSYRQAAALLACLAVIPLVIAETSLHEQRAALPGILRHDVSRAAPRFDVHIADVFTSLATGRLVCAVQRDAEPAYLLPAGLTKLRVPREVAHHKYFVQ